MTKAVLIFTFSPVQSFIAEARRSEDLFNGSAILSRLAQAAGKAIQTAGELIYPAQLQENDTPNVLVARVSQEQAPEIAQKARQALLKEWQEIAEKARAEAYLEEDDLWKRIWKRQVVEAPPWQIFWAVAPETENYAQAYEAARDMLERAKRSRLFDQSEEEGEKDSLSGARTALRTQKYATARKYWEAMSRKPHILSSQVRPEGRELLDSIALVKRFWEVGDREFPSTSTVAAWDFYLEAQKKAQDELSRYRQALEKLPLYRARKQDAVFPYDGDLFFEETLTRQRMKDSYNVEKVDEAALQQVRGTLKSLIQKTRKSPSPYYMLIQFDGDGVGAKIDHLLENKEKAEANHRCFSENIARFSNQVRKVVKPEAGGFLIYNGGDDVLFLASREKGLELARKLAEEYQNTVGKDLGILATASAGVVIAHHLTPLARALSLLHEAEKSAKLGKKDDLGNKGMVCVTLAKRGGEALSALSPWEHVAQVAEWVQAFQNDEVAAVFPYLLARETAMLQDLKQEVKTSILQYLFNRHTGEKVSKDRKDALLGTLTEWHKAIKEKTGVSAMGEIARWLIIARFLASGGAE
ncbi:CRISPR-associated protein, Cmr2 family [Anaerolinea thermolimosa]|uniref:CRISPR-associated protein, Cmr2 family n=1 Tax=Anaerolinea thermolimosa TaxID=229919 RepID=A0A7U9PTB1_9CHLR|nr:type III-B CRISPR-associated protein Cas10/Cmr2 [Anaerolinea thermolimosa]GAP08582.1 CRISPR-associated protein, Cmr2 family [Anaerolinea thermolimosa]